ncbi:MAG: penicillin-binding protein activator [Alphaproteobacteria bacterium]|nr:penicillin-binding protein activator [Alphaproteobacteria bacterium]
MYINKFLIIMGLTALLSGCGGTKTFNFNQPDAVSNPTNVQDSYLSSTSLYGSDDGGKSASIAVLLPMTGDFRTMGNDIKTSVETAFLRKTKPNIKLTFFDLSGTRANRDIVIGQALASNPDVIIGPIFAEDTRILRDKKSSNTPVISFTSDVSALGDDVISVNLIPTQSIETIIRQMIIDGAKSMLVLAPNDESGQTMASVANKAASLYDVPIRGLFYYDSGNSDSIKDVAMRASMYNTRIAVNNRAREVLSDILNKETLNANQRYSLKKQLEKIERSETLGDLPYDAILFLGSGEDSKTLASFLRYYGIKNRDIAFYGTTLWQNSDIASDLTMSGSKYATLPEISENFVGLYSMVAGKEPNHMASFGYDAAHLALGMLYSPKSQSAYLYDPNGYVGTSGIFRIQPNGESERGLRIMELNASETPNTLKESPTNFITTLYNVRSNNLRPVSEKEISTRGINPGDYIKIPEHLRKKSAYKTKTIGANYIESETPNNPDAPIQIFAEDTKEIIVNPDYEPVKLENVSRQNIDSVEIEE